MHGRKNPMWLIVVPVTLLIITTLHVLGWLAPLYDPVSGLFLRLSSSARSVGVVARENLDETIVAAKGPAPTLEQVEALRLENSKLKALLAENEELKQILDFQESDDDEAVVARVVSESPDDFVHALLLDRGSEDGLAEGYPVIVGDGIMIGKVSSLRRHSASVLLLSDSSSALAVSIQNAEGTMGVMKGDRGLSMNISLIPQSQNVEIGETVITSGLEPGIRRGYVVGIIDKIDQSTQDPFQSAVVVPFRSSRHPLYVQIVIPRVDDRR